jgi:leucyl aminopeptidase
MKTTLVIVFLVAIHFANGLKNPLRLIEFNETTRIWMSAQEVEEMANECGKDHGGYMDITDHMNLNANGLSEQIKSRLSASPFPNEPTHQTTVNSFIKLLDTNKLREYNNKLSSFHTRYYTTETGKQAAEWIKSQFEANKAGRTDITVELFPHSWLQSSVVARIPGSGEHADEVVIISAHEDSVNGGATQRSPGADDDASGTSSVLELFRVIVASGFKSHRTLEFHTYSAEEVGLRGSQDIAAAYQKSAVPVYAQMQLDMTFYVKPGTVPSFGIITDYVSPDLTAFLRKLVAAYSTLKYVDSKCGYGCSDHASWTKSGYASCFPFESSFSDLNNKIHTNQDLIEFLNVEHGLEFAKVALGFIVELSLTN